ncbi:AraC family transcriptional regulator [Aurantiacibacter flavus]|uniref:Helix-turn-helix transcriptional regulator n=1 Tax=Aurantiacibacter flavus TaxID=3145232 RepID=A0ABV0D0Y6_9SPHN
MPILTEISDKTDWVNPDEVPRPVICYGFVASDFGGVELDFHRHIKGQIILVQRGALSCEIEGGMWVVPPGSAIWIPGEALHSLKLTTGAMEGYNAFISPEASRGLPVKCCAVSVTPLLREVLTRAVHLPLLYEENGPNNRLIGVLLDELAVASVETLHLPMPTDPRLRWIANAMMEAPAERGTLEVWAKRAGMSERTLERLMRSETGMSFGRWRQQLAIVFAVKWMADGASTQAVAADLGYESVPSFVTMFKKALGTSPGRYMTERHSSSRRHLTEQ